MSGNAVVVADDDAAWCDGIVVWLIAEDVCAHATSNAPVIELIDAVGAGVVICRPGSTGVALFHALQEAAEPPVVVLLSDAPRVRDAVYGNGRLLVVVVRMPVQMPSLARFVKSVVGIKSRLDGSARRRPASPAADMPYWEHRLPAGPGRGPLARS